MPHQCVRCNKFYPDGSEEILKGCPCGCRLFFFVKREHIKEAKEVASNLSDDEKIQMEHDVKEVLHMDVDADRPVILEFESIRVVGPGKYELDLVHLFKKDPLIIKIDEGKYMIDLGQAFKTIKEEAEDKL